MKKLFILLSFAILQTSCSTDANGHKIYTGPSVGVDAGFMGASVGFTLYGQNPTTANKPGLSTGPIQITTSTNVVTTGT